MHDAERVRSALSHIPADSRETWWRMAAAVKSEFGEDGFEIWDQWSQNGGGKYSVADAKSTWKSTKATGGVGLGSLIALAKEHQWKDDSTYQKPTAAEIEKRKAINAARAAQAAAEELAQHEAMADRAKALWEAAAPCTEHAYLARKGVQSHGLRYGPFEVERVDDHTGEVTLTTMSALLVPLMDAKGKIWSLQAISSKEGGAKLLLGGGRKSGNFFMIGGPALLVQGKQVYVLAEGYATGASVHEATGHRVLVCIDAGNLKNVAKVMRAARPDAIILIAADNDTQTDGNPGLTFAKGAAGAVGGVVAFPPDGGDFNDLAQGEGGRDTVAEVILEALAHDVAPPVVEVAALPAPAPEPEPPVTSPARAVPDEELAQDVDGIDPGAHFAVLGYDRGTFYVFIHEQRQIHHWRSGDLTDANLLMLAPLQWWENYFPSTGKAGGFDRKLILDWFFRLAAKRGIFDASRVRGRGAWYDDGRSVYHMGGALYVDGARTDVTKIKSKYVYELAKTQAVPSDTALTDAEGQHLLDIAKMLRWSQPGAAALLAGWAFLAPVGGAIKWRPHLWLTGGAGSGKSTILNEYVAPLLGASKVFANGASSEAGLRQELGQDALPVLFDESEKNTEAEVRRMDGVLALIRQSSTESEARVYKGTMSGTSMHFHVRSMFCLASIQVGMENKADTDRLTKLTLHKAADGDAEAPKKWAAVKDELYKISRDRELPSRFLRRAIDMLPVIQQNITVFVEAAARQFGAQRKGDQYGTMLAGTWSLTRSTLATPADAQAMIDEFDWTEFMDEGETDDAEKALHAVLEAKIPHKGDHISVGTTIAVAAGRDVSGLTLDTEVAARLLRDNGIRIIGKDLVFRNSSTALKALVAGTRFEADLKGQLLRVKGASVTKKVVRFGVGANDVSRAVAIPLALILGVDEPPL